MLACFFATRRAKARLPLCLVLCSCVDYEPGQSRTQRCVGTIYSRPCVSVQRGLGSNAWPGQEREANLSFKPAPLAPPFLDDTLTSPLPSTSPLP